MKPDMIEVTTTVRMLDSKGAESALAFVRSVLEEQGLPVVAWKATNLTEKAKAVRP